MECFLIEHFFKNDDLSTKSTSFVGTKEVLTSLSGFVSVTRLINIVFAVGNSKNKTNIYCFLVYIITIIFVIQFL